MRWSNLDATRKWQRATHMNDVERRQILRRLWMDNHADEKRTSSQLVLFHTWLDKNWPELLAKRTLEELKADLEFLYREERMK